MGNCVVHILGPPYFLGSIPAHFNLHRLAHEFAACNESDKRLEISLAAVLFWGIADFIWTLDHSPMFMTKPQQARAHRTGSLYVKTAFLLAELCVNQKILRWKFRPKVHYMQHTIDDVGRYTLNPRFFMCWLDEDFMGKIAALCSRCHAGNISYSCSAIHKACIVFCFFCSGHKCVLDCSIDCLIA